MSVSFSLAILDRGEQVYMLFITTPSWSTHFNQGVNTVIFLDTSRCSLSSTTR